MRDSEKITTPVDTLTHQPLLLEPGDLTGDTSEHHIAHPRDHSNLMVVKGGPEGGDAVRQARIQTVNGLGGTALMHDVMFTPGYDPGEHRLYHLFFKGPHLPETEREQFEYVTWACTDYVPTQGISLRGGEPNIIDFTPEQIVQVQNSIKIQSGLVVGDFLLRHLKKQELDHVKPSMIDEFVTTQDRRRQRFLGHWLLAQASEVAADPLDPYYKAARKNGQTNPALSPKLANVIQMRLGSTKRREVMIKDWRRSLLAA